jgi:hypothetical protein
MKDMKNMKKGLPFFFSLALFFAAFAGGCMPKTDAAPHRMADRHTGRNSLTWHDGALLDSDSRCFPQFT